MEKCPECGETFGLTRQDKILRSNTQRLAKLLKVYALEGACKRCACFCNKCWKKVTLPLAQDIVGGMLKKSEEENAE